MVYIPSPINGLSGKGDASQIPSKITTTIDEYREIQKSPEFKAIKFDKLSTIFHVPKKGSMEINFILANNSDSNKIESLEKTYPDVD